MPVVKLKIDIGGTVGDEAGATKSSYAALAVGFGQGPTIGAEADRSVASHGPEDEWPDE